MSRSRDTNKMREVRRLWQQKKKRFQKTRPVFMNFVNYSIKELENAGLNVYSDFNVQVIELLEQEEKEYASSIVQLGGQVGKEVIEAIKCPFCDKTIYRDKHWDCFECCCEEERKIFDIMDIQSEELKKIEQNIQKIRYQKIADLRDGKGTYNDYIIAVSRVKREFFAKKE